MVVTNYACLPADLENAVKIGEGKYREVFRADNYALKILKSHVRKNYGLFKIDFPTNLYTKYKFGITDFNQFEYDMFRDFIERIPTEFRNKFSHIHYVGKINGKSCSFSDLVSNCDGIISKTLAQNGKLKNDNFWKQIEELEEVLVDKKVTITDIRGENIMVKEMEEEVAPIFVDFKRYGSITYPIQIWLSSEKQLVEKMKRRFQRLREQYRQY